LPQNTTGDAAFKIDPIAEQEITDKLDTATDGMNVFCLELAQLRGQEQLQAARTSSKKSFHEELTGANGQLPLRCPKIKGQPVGLPFFAVNSITKKLPAVTSTTTVAVTAAATTAPIAPATTEVVTLRHRLGFVDGQRAPVQLRAIQAIDGFLRLTAGAHFNKAEAPRLAGELIGNHICRFDGAVLRKDFLQPVTRH
jgi:hypothetical protein